MTRDELVVLSHLRWDWVWQRPQHLVSRLAAGRRTWFVEEPMGADVDEPQLRVERSGPVRRVWLEVPGAPGRTGFDDPRAATYGDRLIAMLDGPTSCAWLYTPLALRIAEQLSPDLLVYDVMDDLASFRGASPRLARLQREALERADLVFTGGRSLHASVRGRATSKCHLFPSGVEPEHFAPAIAARVRRDRPVAGYVGVIDERVDLELLGGLAAALPDWDLHLVGPVAKIDEADVPRAANIRQLGMQPYERLPAVMADLDVALMPFALNEATRRISPTKTLEYLAAGLPVVSTRVPDVVADHSSVVHLADDAAGFAAACRRAWAAPPPADDPDVRALLAYQHWDAIAARMDAHVRSALGRRSASL